MKIKVLDNKFPLFWFGAGAVYLHPFLFIKKSYKEKLSEVWYQGLISHEYEHYKQVLSNGFFGFYFKYITSKTFRLKCELEAYKAQFDFLKERKINMDKKSLSKSLASKTYFNMVSQEKAWNIIKDW